MISLLKVGYLNKAGRVIGELLFSAIFKGGLRMQWTRSINSLNNGQVHFYKLFKT